jgi:REP element-mobilizing transposase RayT
MATEGTYSQLYIQTVFAVRYRASVIRPEWKERLHQYITGIIQERGNKLLAIHAMPDHIHILFGLRPAQSIADLMRDVKAVSSKWINENGFLSNRFEWQHGYGAFSYSGSEISNVINYIKNQELHHQKISFRNEFRQLLNEFDIAYDERYIFEELT